MPKLSGKSSPNRLVVCVSVRHNEKGMRVCGSSAAFQEGEGDKRGVRREEEALAPLQKQMHLHLLYTRSRLRLCSGLVVQRFIQNFMVFS